MKTKTKSILCTSVGYLPYKATLILESEKIFKGAPFLHADSSACLHVKLNNFPANAYVEIRTTTLKVS